jgi:dihydroceramidase
MQESKGFWGQRTATIDWCESNYEITEYIAEFWNTVSNLVMIVLPLYGIYWSFKHNAKIPKNSITVFHVPKTVIWCNIGLILVGIGSWMFHMTLLYSMQLLDEIPMIFGSGILVYANYDLLQNWSEFKRERLRKNLNFTAKLLSSRKLVLFLIAAYCLLTSYVYIFIYKNPVFHEVAYALMVLMIIYQNITIIYRLNLTKKLYAISFFYYMFGFLLWNIDNNFCVQLKEYRKSIQNYLGNSELLALNILVTSLKSIFELHSLWHIFTGYASFMTILFLIEAHYEHQLNVKKIPHHSNKKARPVKSKFFDLYYHLNTNMSSKLKK